MQHLSSLLLLSLSFQNYAITQSHLKPIYRESGPHLVQKYCNEIESISQTSIQLQWKSSIVKFHIAGLEEGVTRAMSVIREKFEVCYSLCYTVLVILIAS